MFERTRGFESHSPRFTWILDVTLLSYDLRVFLTIIFALQEIHPEDMCTELVTKIDSITQYNPKPYFRQALKRLAGVNMENANVICDYILAEQAEINIKESTKEGKIKVLIWLSNYLAIKPFRQMTKGDVIKLSK